jgi:uncharacterized protein YbaR (Trm112 family)
VPAATVVKAAGAGLPLPTPTLTASQQPSAEVTAEPAAAVAATTTVTAVAADKDTFEFEGELQTLTFVDDGVGIVSVYDESVPVWRELGFARGELRAPEDLPLRIAVNLSLRTAVEAMEASTRRQFERMDDAQLNRSAAAALVPMEHQFLRPLACPRCGNHEHLNLLQQEAIAAEYHPEIASWPFTAPGGDRYTLGCPNCDFLFEVVFWFYE